MQNVFGECRIYRLLLHWKIPPFCVGLTIYNRVLQRILLMGLLRLGIVLKNVNINIYHINIFICLWVTPSWWMHLYKSCLCHRNQQNIKSKILLEQVLFYWLRYLLGSTKWLPKFWHVLSWQITSCGKREHSLS